MRAYIGNIPWGADENMIRGFFAGFEIANIKIVTDHITGKSRGFGFCDVKGKSADIISALDGHDMGGRPVRISEARDKTRDRPPHGEGRKDPHVTQNDTSTL